MDDGVGEEVTPPDAADGGHLHGKENENLLIPESCNILEAQLRIPNEGDYSRSSHQGLEEMFDGKNIRSFGHVNALEHAYIHIPHSMNDAGVTVEELTVRNFGGSNLAVVGTSTYSGSVQTRQNQWQHLYQLAGGSGSGSSRGNTTHRDSGQRMTIGLEDMGYSSFPEFLAQKASNDNPSEVVEELINPDKRGNSGNGQDSIRTKMISKSGFSEFFVKNTLKGKGVIFKGPPLDDSNSEPRDRNNTKLTSGTMAAHEASKELDVKIVNPSSYGVNTKSKNEGNGCDGVNTKSKNGGNGCEGVNTKSKNEGNGCDGVSLREWLKVGQANKIVRLYIFRQIVELVDYSHSQGVALHRLRPSYFMLLSSNKVRYLGSPDKKVILQSMMNQDLSRSENSMSRKKLAEQSFLSVGVSAKKQRLIQNTGVPRQWLPFPTNSSFIQQEVADASHGTSTGQQNSFNEFGEGNLVTEHGSKSKFGNPLVSTTRDQMISASELLEENWYTSPEEFNGGSCTILSNIYCLGVFLFELLAHFDSASALAKAMSDLRHRILPSNFLSENPKEAGFCLWLLHPEPSSRPTTREILQSEVVNGLPETCHEDLSASIDQEDSESDLLMHFLTSLKEQKHEDASKLADAIKCLEADVKEIEKRNCSSSKEHLAHSCFIAEPSVHGRPNAFVHGQSSSSGLSQFPPGFNTNESRLTNNIGQLESAYFSMRSKLQIPVTDVTVRQDNELLRNRKNWYLMQKDEQRQIPTDRVGAFFDGLCKYARYSRFEVRGVLRNGEFNSSPNVVCSLSFDRDEDYFAAAGVSKKIKIFEFNALFNDSVDIHYPAIEMPNQSKLSCVCWNSYIKNYLASTDFDGVVKLWDVTTGQAFSQYNDHERRAWSVDFSKVYPTKVASGSDDCTVKLWNINEQNCIGTIRNFANVCCVQFSAHSTYLLAYGSADYKTYCYDLRYARTPWCVLAGHDKAVSCVKFLDSETIVSASTDNTLKLWDLNKSTSTGSPNACSLTLRGHTNEKNFVGLSVADGYIACGSESNEVYAYYRSLPMPITSHKFGSIDSISGKETDNDNGQFVSSVCWRGKSEMVVAANSTGCIKVLQMV